MLTDQASTAATISGPYADLTNPGSAQLYLSRPSIGGLQPGATYYVANATTNTFQLKTSPGASGVVTLDDTGRSGPHQLVPSSGGKQELRIDLASQPDGDHELLGPGGTSLRVINPPAGDGLSTVRTEGGSVGILFTVSVPTAELFITNDAQAWIAATLVDAGGDIDVATHSVSRGNGYISNNGGGAISAADVQARVNVANSSKAYLTDDGVTLKSGGQVSITSDSSIDTHVYATANGGGLGAGSNAKADTRVDSDSANDTDTTPRGTLTSLGNGARIEADTVNFSSQVSHLSTYAHSHSLAVGFVAVAISHADIDTDSTVKVFIDDGVRVKSTRGVDIGAFHRDASADQDTEAIPIAFIPIPIETGWQQHQPDRPGPSQGRRAHPDRTPRQLHHILTPDRRHRSGYTLGGGIPGKDPAEYDAQYPAYDHLALLVQSDEQRCSRRQPAPLDPMGYRCRGLRRGQPRSADRQRRRRQKAIGTTVDLSQDGQGHRRRHRRR